MSKKRITIELTEENINGEVVLQALYYKGRNYSKVVTNTVLKSNSPSDHAAQVVFLSGEIQRHILSIFGGTSNEQSHFRI